MKFSAIIFAGVAAASYIPAAPVSSAPASSPAYVPYKPSSSSTSTSTTSTKGYGGGYYPSEKPSSSSSSSSSSAYKPTYTTFECDGPTTFTYGHTTYSASTKTSWVLPCEETTTTVPAPVKPTTYAPAPVYPAHNGTTPAYAPSASVTSSGPLQVTANAAVNNVAGAGVGLAGVFAAAAYLL